MVYSVNLTRCYKGEEAEFFHLAVCSTKEKAVEVRRNVVRGYTEGDMFDVCAFDENGNLLTEIEDPKFEIQIAGVIGSDVDNFNMWGILNTDTDDWIEVVVKAMEMDKVDCCDCD